MSRKVAITNDPEPRINAGPAAELLRTKGAVATSPALIRHSLATQARVAAWFKGSPVSRAISLASSQRSWPNRSRQRASGRAMTGSRSHAIGPGPDAAIVQSRAWAAEIVQAILTSGLPSGRRAIATELPSDVVDQSIAARAPTRVAVPFDLDGQAQVRQQLPHPPLQVRTQQWLGPVVRGFPTLDHAEMKSLPALADIPFFINDIDVVDQEIALLRPLLGFREMDTARLNHAGNESIDPDRQDRGLGNAGLHRVNRRIPRCGVADNQLDRQKSLEPRYRLGRRDLGDATRRPQPPITLQTLESTSLEEKRTVEFRPGIE